VKDWDKTLISPRATVAEAVGIIDQGDGHICLVVDENRCLLGTITDGDIRRGILRALPLDAPVSKVMKREPIVGLPDDGSKRLLELMLPRDVRQLPIVDSHFRVVGLMLRDELSAPEPLENQVVFMAGGLGSRLRPMTDDTPKPLLTVGQKPLLETILETFIEHGFQHFHMSVNYKADQIIQHFGNGEHWGVDINYLMEDDQLGTAGALGLLPEIPDEPIFVMNADVLTKVNFRSILDFHFEQRADATMCVREYDFQVPYGVVNIENDRITGIEEKPLQTFFVNAGIYVVSPELLHLVAKGERLDMPEFFHRAIDDGRHAAVFPVREYWLDVGRLDDFERANGEFSRVFES
jgi:dTDP-glucose pyrophosphorylase